MALQPAQQFTETSPRPDEALDDAWQKEASNEQQSSRMAAEEKAKKQGTSLPAPGSFADRMGHYFFRHKDFYRENPLPWYGIRNAASASLALAGLTTVFVPVRYGFHHVRDATKNHGGSALQKGIYRAFGGNENGKAPSLLAELMAAVGLSFSTFRTIFKDSQHRYDDVTNANSPEEAALAVKNLGKDFIKDFVHIAPAEYPSTIIAAMPLVAIRQGFRNLGAEGDTIMKDTMGSWLAYFAFFNMNERLYDDLQSRKGYHVNEHTHVERDAEGAPVPHAHQAAVFEDSPARLVFNQFVSVAAGISAYIPWSRWAQGYKKPGLRMPGYGEAHDLIRPTETNPKGLAPYVVGGGVRGNSNFAKEWNQPWMMSYKDNPFYAWFKENNMYQGFFLYTTVSEAARNNLDKLYHKICDKDGPTQAQGGRA